jgi:hypothetical protein
MALLITCPECKSEARLVALGRVVEHTRPEGTICVFVQTPGNTLKGDGASSAGITAHDLEKLDERRANLLAYQVAKREKHERAKVNAENAKAKERAKNKKHECPVCLGWVAARPSGELAAHIKPTSGRWCGGGEKPSESQRNKAAKGKSPWTSSGGLPSLGKHN